MMKSKENFMEVRIQAEMREDIYKEIPDHLKDEMTIKRIDMPNYKDLYKKDKIWNELNDNFIKSLVDKQDREAEIRVNNQIK